MLAQHIDAIKENNLCFRCVGEAYLSAEVRSQGKRRKCSYCGRTRRCYDIGMMAERIEAVFEEHYVRTSDQPNSWQVTMLSDPESNYDWERDGEPVVYAIMNAADTPETAAEDIQKILEEKHEDFELICDG